MVSILQSAHSEEPQRNVRRTMLTSPRKDGSDGKPWQGVGGGLEFSGSALELVTAKLIESLKQAQSLFDAS
jgi:hypothetical protein